MVETKENAVFIGKKPLMNYVLAVVTQFNTGVNDVIIKARGKAISRAVDVVEVVRNRFMSDAKIGVIKIGTENVTTESGQPANVSSIEIHLTR